MTPDRKIIQSIRKLHAPTRYDGCNWCQHCISLDIDPDGDPYMQPWPCDTARLVYASEELQQP